MDEGQSSPPQPTPGKNNMLLLGLVALVVIGVLGLVVLFAKPQTATAPATTSQEQVSPTPEGVQVEVTQETEDAMSKGKEVTVNVQSESFKFTPAEIRVKKSDTVKIVLTNKAGTHDFTLDEFGVKTKTLSAGQTDQVTFVANKAGTFEYYCSVGNHRQLGMVGKLIVE